MSLNNVLPWWVYAVQYERFLAECSCCFKDEWCAGFSRELPDYVVKIIQQEQSTQSR